MLHPDKISATLERLYETPFGNDKWTDFLGFMNRQVPGARFTLNESSWRLGITPNLVDPLEDRQLRKVYFKDMLNKEQNPLFDRFDIPFGTLFDSAVYFPGKTLSSSAIYHEIYRHMGVDNLLMTPLFRKDSINSMLAINYNSKQEGLRDAATSALKMILPHARKAMGIRDALQTARKQVSLLEDILDRSHKGVVLMNKQVQVTYFNATAETIFNRNDGLKLDRAHTLQTGNNHTTRELNHQIHHLISSLNGSVHSEDLTDAVVVPRKDDQGQSLPPYHLLISAKPTTRLTSYDREEGQASIMILINDPIREITYSPQILKRLFGLTKAETEVFNMMVQGLNSPQIAELRGSSARTVQNQINAITEKANARDKTTAMVQIIMKAMT